MDPTKSFDHLDPKLKETYARVMGTDMSSNNNQSAPDPALSATPNVFDPSQPTTDPNQLGPSPFTQPSPTPTADTGPNPGTGPSITTIPTDTSSLFSPPVDTQSSSQSTQETNPPTSSFFSNPSPVSTDPSQTTSENISNTPVEPATVTPYAPEGLNVNQNATSNEQYPQPLPSPASINQTTSHETSPLLRVLYIVFAAIFFAVYTIFWIKVFNLPFLF